MSKSSYKIPVSLDRSRLDHEIPIEAWQMRSRPIPVKVLLYWVVVIFAMMWILTQSPLSSAPWYLRVLLGLWILVAAGVLGRRNKTGEFTFMRVPALMAYAPSRNRKVVSRYNSKPYGFMTIVGIKEVHGNGLIDFIDGDVGQMYSVVGSASRLLFQVDREAIMRRVDSFYQKIDTDSSWIQITTKEPQRVFQQIAATERRNRALEYRDPGLDALLAEQARVLVEEVGGQFDSLHQYILVRSPNVKALRNAHKVLASEVGHSVLYLRRCELLDGAATLEVLAPIYRAGDVDRGHL